MRFIIQKPQQALNKIFLRETIKEDEFVHFKNNLQSYLQETEKAINANQTESHLIDSIKSFLRNTFYKDHYINSKKFKGNIEADLVIHSKQDQQSRVEVLLEIKTPHSTEMITKQEVNKKAFQEAVLYYLWEKIVNKNNELKNIIITDINEWFIFDAKDFEKLFYEHTELRKFFESWHIKKTDSDSTRQMYFFIQGILQQTDNEITATHFNIRNYTQYLKDDPAGKELKNLFKLYKPEHILKKPVSNDSNQLNKEFYSELLHIIGLEEIKEGSKKLIKRKKQSEEGSLLENVINAIESRDKLSKLQNPLQYGSAKDDQLFAVALELCLTWINRILFLKLLEAQLIRYHNGDITYKFLNTETISDFDELGELFFEVLAVPENKRKENIREKFAHIPYLNSSLFEFQRDSLEDIIIDISNLKDHFFLPLYSHTVLKDKQGKKQTEKRKTLQYFFEFLDAYNFASEGKEEIVKDKKNLINASVLGLIFEKINGYKDGSYFTPSFITMYMCRETIRRAVVQKFNEKYSWECESITDLYNKIENIKEANAIINSLKICDPAVGSGHFLVSALNEIIAIKAELGILCDKEGKRLKGYDISIENDELMITDENGDIFEYTMISSPIVGGARGGKVLISPEKQRVQETLFHEKQTIIENCLFGVDINPNSVKICRLRLWIELLKNAYYILPVGNQNFVFLQTLPNIDINIKQGNSLISRFDINDKHHVLEKDKKRVEQIIKEYKEKVWCYKVTNDKKLKETVTEEIKKIKEELQHFALPNDKDYLLLKKKREEMLETPMLFSQEEREEWIKKTEERSKELAVLEQQYEEKLRTLYKDAFEWRFEFPEVLDKKGEFMGFDVVIGNPPYGADIDKFTKFFEKKYPKTTESFKDIYKIFYELSLDHLIKINGVLSFITPNTFILQPRYKDLRKFLLSFRISSIVNLGENVFQAVVPTAVTIIQKGLFKKYFTTYADLTKGAKFIDELGLIDYEKLDQKEFELNSDFSFIKQGKKYLGTVPLVEVIDFKDAGINYQRVNVGLGEKGKSDLSERLLYEGEIESKEDVMYWKGTDIDEYYIKPKTERFVRLSTIQSLKENERVVLNTKYFSITPKLIWRQTAQYPIVSIDYNGCWFGRSIQGGTIKNEFKSQYNYHYLLALLNSSFVRWVYLEKVQEGGRVFPQVKMEKLWSLPIKKISPEAQKPFINIVDQILSITSASDYDSKKPPIIQKKLKTTIDAMVYKLYDLTYEEIKIIDPDFEMSEKQYLKFSL